MKSLGRAAALCGLAAAIWLFMRDHPGDVFRLMRGAGAGLVLAALAHVVPMAANALDWRSLIRRAPRPRFATMLKLVWIRESVNGLLPVARIGGEIVSFRLLGAQGVRPETAVASLVADMQLTLISQLLFALAGVGFLLHDASSGTLRVVGQLAFAITAAVPLLLLFALVQHAKPFERIARVLNRVTGGKVYGLVGRSTRIDQSVKLIWRQSGVVLRYLFVWQTLQCVATAFEIWLALYFLGSRVSAVDAFVLEVLIQLLSSVAFLVPAGLGVQEGGFVLIGGLIGLDPATSLALAGARRIRDLLIYVPGLVMWQFAEYAQKGRRTAGRARLATVASGERGGGAG
ncbi:lysylphosphatidylglycerol synthase domain-containing protein [Paraburkholderia caballeronis]|uniref:lysylphosphatidylglycerol synthase domain-containing protein n=1 Tax=Paraburkholderia caballeronis TaxID=416943 RepID=UPI001065C291|nr:lysylphosphatidylglycerol synthase domain-containing protein [Paraburkholderia caballeronis]TDV15546.1 putative membrane protein [Paraburkholderia caballeronis]TDV17801.1 putative membrane protein [Paraburkholderia caballeronis]TDV26585.1 putative membrane protein [Paraburkholderia caballeronis]